MDTSLKTPQAFHWAGAAGATSHDLTCMLQLLAKCPGARTSNPRLGRKSTKLLMVEDQPKDRSNQEGHGGPEADVLSLITMKGDHMYSPEIAPIFPITLI